MERFGTQNVDGWQHTPVPGAETASEYTDRGVKYGFGESPTAFKLQHEMEMDPENTILFAADTFLYFGGPLEVEDYVTVRLRMPVYGAAPGTKEMQSVTVKRISEDKRTIAYAIDTEKAKRYIVSNKSKSVA